MYLSLAAVFIIFTIILFLYLVCIFDIFVGHNITMDNFFTTVPLAEKLLKENLTIVGTLRKCKRDIPAIIDLLSYKGNLRALYACSYE